MRDYAARFNKQDTAIQLQLDTRSRETAQLESRAAEEAKDEEAAKNELIGQQAKYADVLKLQEIMTCGKLYPINVAITKRTMKFTWWKRPVPWLIMRNSQGDQKMAPAVKRLRLQHKWLLARHQWKCPLMTRLFWLRAAEVAAGVASAKGAAGAGQERFQQKWLLAPHQWRGPLMHPAEKERPRGRGDAVVAYVDVAGTSLTEGDRTG